jgi:hypothetical protein
MVDGGSLELTNCVLRVVSGDTRKHKGKVRLRLNRCLVWNSEDDFSATAILCIAAGLDVDARNTYFLALGLVRLDRPLELNWHGTGNLYRSLHHYRVHVDHPNLDDWRQKLNTDLDSVEEPPLLFNPQQWRLLPDNPDKGKGPGGKDPGADVDRILHQSD